MTKDQFILFTLIALAIFAQGLYFTEQWLFALILVVTGLILLVYRRKTLIWPNTFVCKMLVLYVFLHLVGYGFYLEKGMLVFGLLKSTLHLGLYLLYVQLRKPSINAYFRQAYLWAMVVAGYITTVFYMVGGWDPLQYIIHNRAAGPVQYANTFGMLLLVALMIISQIEMNKWLSLLGVMGLMMPLILTMSRGTYIIAGLMLGLLFIIIKPSKATLLTFITSIIVGLLVMGVFDQGDTAVRLTQASGASEWQSRLLYYKDALKMVLARPLGYGPNGYHYAQSYYQTGSTYHVKFVHSGLLQHFLDLGLMGGLWMAALMFYSVFLGGHSIGNRLILMVILGHSLIDMHLQFPLVWIMVIFLLSEKDDMTKDLIIGPKLGLTISACVLALAVYSTLPVLYFATSAYEKAIDYYPYYTEAYRRLLSKDGTVETQIAYAERLERLNPFITQSYPVLRDSAIKAQDYHKAITYSRQMVDYSPIYIEHHEQYSHILILGATYWHAYGEDDQAVKALEELVQIPNRLDKLAKELNTDYNVKHKPDLKMNEAMMKDYVEASYLMNKIVESQAD